MSFRVEVIADGSGQWAWNANRFHTYEEAVEYALDLQKRWKAVRRSRVIECDDPVSAAFAAGKLVHIRTGLRQ